MLKAWKQIISETDMTQLYGCGEEFKNWSSSGCSTRDDIQILEKLTLEMSLSFDLNISYFKNTVAKMVGNVVDIVTCFLEWRVQLLQLLHVGSGFVRRFVRRFVSVRPSTGQGHGPSTGHNAGLT